MNPEIESRLTNLRESLEWFEDSAKQAEWYAALAVLEDIIERAESLRYEVEDLSNQGN